ncbi:MAG: ketopantoate reductase family protein [Lachnospiraceae bacterium]|nr:ketopantoate reductase family protein [Lachnospiraceae bacterium]
MKYVVIGAGGTGGGIGGFLSKAGKDVTLIARGEHLRQMKEHGLQFETPNGNFTVPVKACSMEEFWDVPDVIFVCVKGYSLDEAIPFIKRIADMHTVVIPILNIFGTGKRLQQQLPDIPVTDGCIYIAAEIKQPGTILMSGTIFRVVYGLRRDTPVSVCEAVMPVLENVQKDLEDAEITPLISKSIEKDALQKFSFVSPMAALGACYDINASAIQTKGEMRDTFIAMIQEIKALSDAMGFELPDNITEINLKIMDELVSTATASMHRDIRAGRQSEIDGLVYQVVRLGEQYHVPMHTYERIAEQLRKVV